MQAQRQAGRHPAMDGELAHLADTLGIIERERAVAAREA